MDWGEDMKFKAESNLYVKLSNKYVQRTTGLKGFYFDKNGVYETNNEVLKHVLSQNFEQVTDTFNCKKCDFETDNRGLLMSHYRKEHPKEG